MEKGKNKIDFKTYFSKSSWNLLKSICLSKLIIKEITLR